MTTEGKTMARMWSFKCPTCQGSQFARVDEQLPSGAFAKGFVIRCVECKRDYDTLAAFAENAQLLARVGELGAEVSVLRGAISWVQSPFVDAQTADSELRTRLKFLLHDVAKYDARALTRAAEAKDGEAGA